MNIDKSSNAADSNHPLQEIFNDNGKALGSGIQLLDENESMRFWESLFGTQKERQFFPQDHWLNGKPWEYLNINWMKYYNQNLPAPFVEELGSKIALPDNAPLFFFFSPHEVVQVEWKVFLENWLEFFEYHDEAYIWLPEIRRLLLICPIGNMKTTTV